MVTGFTLPKLLWVRDNEPQNFERVRKVLLPKDYVRFKLTGEYATEVSDASGTSLFDVVNRRGPTRCATRSGSIAASCPQCYESVEVSGKLSAPIADSLGLAAGTPVVGGGGDQAASAVGNGIVESGVVSCTLGTSGVVFAHMDQPHYDPKGRVHTFCHAVPGKWHVMGVTQGAGLSLQWLRNQLMPGAGIPTLTEEAATAELGSQGLYWLPYLMGERTPHLDATARAAWVGLTAKHTRADLIRSVIEGVCYSQNDGLDIIEEMGVQAAFRPAVRRRSAEPVLAATDGRCSEQADHHARDRRKVRRMAPRCWPWWAPAHTARLRSAAASPFARWIQFCRSAENARRICAAAQNLPIDLSGVEADLRPSVSVRGRRTSGPARSALYVSAAGNSATSRKDRVPADRAIRLAQADGRDRDTCTTTPARRAGEGSLPSAR